MKFTWKKAAAFAAMAALTVSFAGCGGGDKKADDKKAAPKGNDKELVMYMGIVEQAAKVVASEFEKDTGIKVKFVRMSGGETLSRIRAEKNNPQASLWYGGSADSFIMAKKEGLLEAYKSPTRKRSKPISRIRKASGPEFTRAIWALSWTNAGLRNTKRSPRNPGMTC